MQHEVIYLSEGKLRQFLPSPRAGLLAPKVNVSLPFVGVNLEASVADDQRKQAQRLRRVEKQLAKSARPATATDLHPGQWVAFEASLRWVTLQDPYRDLVLFVDPAPEATTTRRLLLHGSARHLLGVPPPAVDGPALQEIGGGGTSAGTAFVTNAGRVVSALVDAAGSADPGAGGPPATQLPSGGVRALVAALDAADTEISTAARVSGYARVTGLLPGSTTNSGCLVASPLVVRYVQ